MANPISVQVETFDGGNGSHRSIRAVYNCTIRQEEVLETWGEKCTWGPYTREIYSVIMGDTAPVMIWVDAYCPLGSNTSFTAEVAWVDKSGFHQGRLYPDGEWISESTTIPGRFGLGFLRGKIKEVRPNFFED